MDKITLEGDQLTKTYVTSIKLTYVTSINLFQRDGKSKLFCN